MQDWICIFRTTRQSEAEMTKGLLTHHEINSVVLCKQDSSYKFGDYEVLVNRNDAAQAEIILNENLQRS